MNSSGSFCYPFTVYRLRFTIPTVYGSPFQLIFRPTRTGVRVAEGAGLENRYTLTGIVGSNPTLSVPLPQFRRSHPGSQSTQVRLKFREELAQAFLAGHVIPGTLVRSTVGRKDSQRRLSAI